MFATNLILILAFVAMVAGFVWLFRDGEGPAHGPSIAPGPETDEDDRAATPRVRKDEPPAE